MWKFRPQAGSYGVTRALKRNQLLEGIPALLRYLIVLVDALSTKFYRVLVSDY